MPGLVLANIKTPSNTAVTDANTMVSGVYTKFELTKSLGVKTLDDRETASFTHSGTPDIFYFHPDHLGSSSYITNQDGTASQHMEYMPFGETLVDEHTNSFSTPFKFNSKEHDEETGNYYYYGARYYDPKWSTFISVDPMVEFTDDAYGYCYQNPVNFIDPTGMYADGWIEDNVTGEVCWDDDATSQENTPHGYTYRGEQYEKVVGGMQMLYESNGTSVNAGIALSQVTITTPDPWRGTYFDRRNYDKGHNPFSPPTSIDFGSLFDIEGGWTIWGADRSGDTSGLKGTTKDSYNYDEFVTPARGGTLKGLSGFSARARALEVRNDAITIVKAVPGGFQAGDAIGGGIQNLDGTITTTIDTTHHTLHTDSRQVERRTGPMQITGRPEDIQRKRDSIKAKTEFYNNWFNVNE